jgi:hypothetical protein
MLRLERLMQSGLATMTTIKTRAGLHDRVALQLDEMCLK